jgi:hypothetical protein
VIYNLTAVYFCKIVTQNQALFYQASGKGLWNFERSMLLKPEWSMKKPLKTQNCAGI